MSRSLWKGILLALLVTLASTSACTSLLGTFEVGEGGGGEGGAGGDTTGGSGGTTTTTTGVDCSTKQCCADEACPDTGTECATPRCLDYMCSPEPTAPGTVVSEQVAGDCKQRECDGAGAELEAPQDTDVLDDGNDCTADTCDTGTPLNTNLPAATPCTGGGGQYCDGAGACVECTEPAHCASGVCGAEGACLAATCTDTVKNGDETDTDCGGSCDGCDTAQICAAAGDCYHQVCDVDGLCAEPACDDGVQNGGGYLQGDGETDVDCGGPCGATCGPMEGCQVDGDCQGGSCSGAVCLPTCFDQVQNNDEADVDCGGMCAPCDNGETCAGGADCASSFCADGVCCDTACGSECEACTATLKGGGVDGQCGAIAAGTDPEDECAPEAPETCGNLDGTCSGALGCTKHPAGTACGDAPSCAAGTATNQDTCSGAGSCTDNGTTPCGLYACGAAACNATCSSNADCAANGYCDMGTGTCVPKKPVGQVCSANSMCQSGSCADGVCCNAACGGTCQACNLAGSLGTCSFIASGTDPGDTDCPGATSVCNGAGLCKTTTGAACAMASQCLSAFCADGVCCNTACNTTCQACSGAKTGGANGTCANVPSNQDPDNECAGGDCNGAGACEAANGAACTLAAQCQSGFCVDGFCCNAACSGSCQACSNAKSGGPSGTCTSIPSNQDPDNECAGGDCNGAGVCEAANGAACSANAQCQSGFCVDGFCCNAACSGSCQACSNAKSGGPNGTCTSIPSNQDPDNECAGGDCNGAGVCEAANGTACTLVSQCQSGFCVDGFCCDGLCSFTCTACSMAKTGTANGTCSNVTTGTDPDVECPGTTNCNGLGQCGLLAQGIACTQNAECSSGFCVDGRCCNTACNGTCQACSLAKKGAGANGTCGVIVANTDPDNECAAGECNGAGACEVANGSACTLATQCLSGFCADGVCCDTACSGLCQACSLLKTGAANGTCSNVVPGTDPDNECPALTPNCAAGGICGP